MKIKNGILKSVSRWDVKEGTFNIPEEVKRIGPMACCELSNLMELTIPKTVEVIEDNAFFRCRNLTRVIFKGSDTRLGTSVFCGCMYLVDVRLPQNLEKLPIGTFAGCKMLESMILPNTLHEIGDLAFRNCMSLTEIAIPNDVDFVHYRNFMGCENVKIVYHGHTYTYDDLETYQVFLN